MDSYRNPDGWAALGDPTRRAILACLADQPLAVVELAARLPISRPAVSQHLKILKTAGLVSEQAVGNRRIYRLNPEAVAALRDQLDTFWQRALTRYADIAADADLHEESAGRESTGRESTGPALTDPHDPQESE